MQALDKLSAHVLPDLSRTRKRRPQRYLEHQSQCAVFQWAKYLEKTYPEIRFMFAIDNAFGRKVTPAQAGRLKAAGVRAGPPDICLPVVIPGVAAGLWIEMKSENGRLSESQVEYRDFLIGQGYRHMVAFDPREAIFEITKYLDEYQKARDERD